MLRMPVGRRTILAASKLSDYSMHQKSAFTALKVAIGYVSVCTSCSKVGRVESSELLSHLGTKVSLTLALGAVVA